MSLDDALKIALNEIVLSTRLVPLGERESARRHRQEVRKEAEVLLQQLALSHPPEQQACRQVLAGAGSQMRRQSGLLH